MITSSTRSGKKSAALLFALGWLAGAASSFAAPLTDAEVKAAIPEIKKIAQKALQDTGIPGMAIAIVHNDKVLFAEGFGVRKVGEPQTVDADTVFQLASVSKPLTSTVIARVVSEGKVNWDDTIIKYEPSFRLKDDCVSERLTLRDLLCHRSGLPDHAGDALEDLGYDRAEILAKLHFFPLENRFRADYAYTNFGITAAAVAVANAEGTSWEELITEKLFKPLGMTHTSAKFADFRDAKNRAVTHVPNNKKLKADGIWVAQYTRDPDAQSPAGGVSSSAHDMAQWMRLQLAGGNFDGRKLIKKEALAETHMPHMLTSYDISTGKSGFYGLCWNVGTDEDGRVFWKHSGEFMLGARTVVSLCPSENLGIVVLVNASPSGLPEGIELSFFDLLFRQKPTRDWITFANGKLQELTDEQLVGDRIDYAQAPKDPQKALPPAAYVGTYQNDFYGPLAISERNGKLEAKLGAKTVTLPLDHYTDNTFYCETEGEMASGTSGVVFGHIKNDQATTVILNFLNKEGLGEFRR